LISEFVPGHFEFSHVSRADVIAKHTRPLAKHLLWDNSVIDVICI